MKHNSVLSDWLALLGLTFEEIKARFHMHSKNLDSHTSYGNLARVVELHNASAHPARFYFRDAKPDGKPIAIVIDTSDTLDKLDPGTLRAELGAPRDMLASRAGKDFTHYVYPKRGVAFSANADSVAYLEIFPPTTLAQYEQDLYLDPGPFVK